MLYFFNCEAFLLVTPLNNWGWCTLSWTLPKGRVVQSAHIKKHNRWCLWTRCFVITMRYSSRFCLQFDRWSCGRICHVPFFNWSSPIKPVSFHIWRYGPIPHPQSLSLFDLDWTDEAEDWISHGRFWRWQDPFYDDCDEHIALKAPEW